MEKISLTDLIRSQFYIFQIIGFSPFSIGHYLDYKPLKWINLYVFAHIVLQSTLAIYGVIQPNVYDRYKNSVIGSDNIADIFQVLLVRSTRLVILIESLYRQKEQIEVLQKFTRIDSIFADKFNVNINTKKIKFTIWICFLSLCASYSFCQFMFCIGFVRGNEIEYTWFWLMYISSDITLAFRYFQINILIWCIKIRIEKLNKLLEEFCGLDVYYSALWPKNKNKSSLGLADYNLKSTPKFGKYEKVNGFKGVSEKLNILRELHHSLWQATELVNKCFGVSVICLILAASVSVIIDYYYLIIHVKLEKDFLVSIASFFWAFSHVFNIIAFCSLCHHTVLQVRLYSYSNFVYKFY